MNSWIPNKKIIVASSLTLFVCIVVYISFFILLKRKVHSIEVAYSNTASILSLEEQARVNRFIALENKDNIDFINQYFIERGDEVLFIEDIEKYARSLNLKFDIVSISPVKPTSSEVAIKETLVKMNLEGSWQNLIVFLDGLYKLPFGVSVQNFGFDKASNGIWGLTIEFVVFN